MGLEVIMPRLRGAANGKLVNKIVRQELANG